MIHRWLTKLGRNSSGSGGGKLIAAVLNAHPPSTAQPRAIVSHPLNGSHRFSFSKEGRWLAGYVFAAI